MKTGPRIRVMLLAAGAIIVVSVVFQFWTGPRLYRTTFLPSAGPEMMPTAMNDLGQVVGRHVDASHNRRYFLWDREGGLRDLGPWSDPFRDVDINNRGQIALTMKDGLGRSQACLRDPNGALHFLGTLGGSISAATAISDEGYVAGWSMGPAAVAHVRPVEHAFLWDRVNGMRDLGTVKGHRSFARVVNDAGQVFGSYEVSEAGHTYGHPGYWNSQDGFAASGITLPNDSYSDMNRRGWIVGTQSFDDGGPHIVLWQDYTGLEKLFPHEPAPEVFERPVLLVNDVNQVVYSERHFSDWQRRSKRLFPHRLRSRLWDPGRGEIPLNRYVPAGGGDFVIQDLNNKGCIVGYIRSRDGRRSRAVLLEPIPKRWGR